MLDAEILDLFFARDEQAIAKTDEKYGKGLLRLSTNITGSALDGEECLNDTYAVAWNRIPPLRPVRYYAWLCRVIRNLSVTVLEAKTAKKRNAIIGELDECIPSDTELDGEVRAEELGACIDKFIRTLDGDSAKAFVLRYFHSEPIGKVADELGWSEGKTKTVLFRLRARLKDYLVQNGF